MGCRDMTIYSYCRTSELEATLDTEQLETILEPEMLAIQTYCLRQSWFMTESLKDSDCNWSQNPLVRLGQAIDECTSPR